MKEELLKIPKGVGELILRRGGVVARPLLATNNFVTFCRERGLRLSQDRLLCLERLKLFAPIFRVKTPDEDTPPLSIPVGNNDKWFRRGWAWDTTGMDFDYEVPTATDQNQEAYYSVFQIDHLSMILSGFTMSLNLDGFLDHQEEATIDWEKNAATWMDYARQEAQSLQSHEYRPAVALLCQFVSDRYFPYTRSNQRTMLVPRGPRLHSDHWTQIYVPDWDWYSIAKNWDAHEIERLFDLTPEKLKHAYRGLALSQSHCDPLERWYQLVQFISVRERDRLKGKALRAESIRTGAFMLQRLYKDVYNEDLPHPNEMYVQIITHIPELEVREDARRYLEFVVNRYTLNPTPTLSLFVEGASEEAAIHMIFERYYGVHPGKCGIEIIVLGGIDTATGGKADRFRAILRLIDYLHHHQTYAFLILDNENHALKLKEGARKAKSTHHKKRYVTRPEYIRIWKSSFEFDNFSATEIATAMSLLNENRVRFSRHEVISCKKENNPGSALSILYKRKVKYNLEKIKLNQILLEEMLSPNSKQQIANRPIVKALERVRKLAARNPFPTRQAIWERNQASKYLGKKRRY
jgi:hypothetical protein